MNQIVFVVIDHEEQKVLGVFNDELTAKRVAMDWNKLDYTGEEITITPVLVDTVNWVTASRQFCLTEQQVAIGVQEEIELAMPYDEDEDEDEDEDGCDGECDICCDLDCPSNASMFDPRDDDDEYDFEEEEEDESSESLRRVKDDFIRRYVEAGFSLTEAFKIANALFGEDDE